MIKQSGVPYTIIRSTQFFEFMGGIANKATVGNEVHLSDVLFQPIASDDVASFVAKYALEAPKNGIVQIAGPQRFALHGIISQYLKHLNDPRIVVPDGKPEYFGGEITHAALVPSGEAEPGTINFEKWLSHQLQPA